MLIRGDARRIPLVDACVDCVVTSPPYWALRRYGEDERQIGSEPSRREYLDTIVQIFREVKRVLKPTGTCWVNMGDGFGSGTSSPGGPGNPDVGAWSGRGNEIERNGQQAKQLLGIPWHIALALQADGWYLRSDIIWSKPNPMPESVTDRPTKAHEYLFLLTKSERYFYDAATIAKAEG